MKALTLLLLLFSINSFAQTETKPAAKPSTTDCPTWGSKPNQSKAAYYESLRHKKPVAEQPGVVSKTKAVKPKKIVNHTPAFNASSDKVMEQKKPTTEGSH
jgi:hypothetical protein